MSRALLIASVAILCCLAGFELVKMAGRVGGRITGTLNQSHVESVKWVK